MPCLLSKGEEAVLPDRLDPGRLVEMQIFESITLGELSYRDGFDASIGRIEYPVVNETDQQREIAEGEKENTVYDPIISI
jgi:hypothetical protein